MYRTVVVSCEHAGNNVPDQFQHLFYPDKEILQTHRGWDAGAWAIAEALAARLHAPLFGCHTTRLLIEANRSPTSPELFSHFSVGLPDDEKEKLIRTIYLPYRNQVIKALHESVKPVLHLSIHSFTPTWQNVERTVDIGILFDPDRATEKEYSHLLKKEMEKNLPAFSIQLNEPYKGTDDGFTTWLRTCFANEFYTGIEIEVNQKFASDLSAIQNQLFESIRSALNRLS